MPATAWPLCCRPDRSILLPSALASLYNPPALRRVSRTRHVSTLKLNSTNADPVIANAAQLAASTSQQREHAQDERTRVSLQPGHNWKRYALSLRRWI